ncbi:hypothetical protein I317_04161 [Kwoniella heveanensis CBS 569]|nr:hypothetical protein I317_04161 [Kwoniella heveanensis CBS 569]
MSSLAAQLQNIASLDAARLTSKYGAPSSKSYLFPPKVASTHDLDSIFALAQSGFEELLTLDPPIEEYEDELFSERAKRTDRMMLSKEENDALDQVIGQCLRRLGRWIGVMAGGKCIEWLVRRFRVHEMNADVLLEVFLPYHESPNFPRILAILTISQTSPYYAPFSPLIKNAQAIPRSYIATAISPAKDKSLHLLTNVAGLAQQAIKEKIVHRALLTFWSAIMVDLLEGAKSGKGVQEGLVKVMVEVFVTILSTPNGGEDVNAAVYPPLVLLTRSITLVDEAFLAVVSALLTSTSGADASQRILTLLVVLNDRPSWSGGLGADASKHLSKIKQLGEILIAATEKYGFDAPLKVVLEALLEQPDTHFKVLSSLLDHRDLSTSNAALAASVLLRLGSSDGSDDDVKASCKSLLVNLRERHPSIVDAVYVEASGTTTLDAQLVQKPADEIAFLNVYAADVSSRIQGVKEVMELYQSGNDNESAVSALVARLGDTDEPVIQAIYEDPESLLEITFVDKYIAGVKPTFWSVSPKSIIVGHHLDYISNNLLTDKVLGKYPNAGRQVFQELLFPCLLSTEKRQPLTNAEALKILGGGMQNIEYLSKIVPEIAKTRAANVKGSAPKSNLLIAKALAEAIAASSHFNEDVGYLVTQLDSKHASTRLLAHLIVAQLITATASDKQIPVAVKVLRHLKPKQSTLSLRDIDQAEEPFSALYLDAIYRKTTEARTTQMAVVSILAAAIKVVKPIDESTTWLAGDSPTAGPVAPYKVFSQELYSWSNSGVLPPSLAQVLLRALLAQLGEEALLFLASVWTSQSPLALRTASLRHATAFVSAYAGVKIEQGIDFQIMIPSVLVALRDSEKPIRAAAVDLLRAMALNAQASENIYALDTVYGSRSDTVQLLKPSDRRKYIQALLDSSDEMIVDATRVRAVHIAALGPQHGARNRKDSSHRRAVIGALASHITAYRSFHGRVVLLNLLIGVTDHAVFRGILPLLTAIDDGEDAEALWLANLSAPDRAEYLGLLFSTLKAYSVSVLTEEESPAWEFLLSLVDTQQDSVTLRQLRKLSLHSLADGVFAVLPAEQKIEYILAVVNSLHSLSTEEALASAKILRRFELDTETIVQIIDHLSDAFETTTHRKKQRQDEGDDDRPTSAVLDLTALIESREWHALPGDANLVASLMAVLSSLLTKRLVIKEGVDYLEQEVLAAILALVEKIRDPQEIQRAHVGIEVIIKVIRASSNPRTSQRALLVASELARLIPEAVLHNIMPIFTFMGASDFQRDDAYSFGVVEKTISRIVPVMAQSLVTPGKPYLDIYNESLTFLSIFTDMATRLPKHRTLPFFVHLVRFLGPAEFLAPVCMLLVDRATTKAGRSGNSISTVLELPSALAAAFDHPYRTEVLSEVIIEVTRLVDDLTRTEKEAFLSATISENDASDRPLKQIAHLLTFSAALVEQLRGKACAQDTVQRIVRNTIVLAAKTSQPLMATTDVSKNVQAVLAGSMQLLSAEHFLGIVIRLLTEGSQQDKIMALNTFAERVSLIKSEVRAKSNKAIADILKTASSFLGAASSSSSAALSAIRIVASGALPGEDGALAQVIPTLVAAVPKQSDSTNIIASMELIILLTRHLGSRTIPHIQSIIDLSLSLIASSKSISSVVKACFSTLAALLEVVSTFVSSKQLATILRTAIDHRARDSAQSLSMSSTVAKRMRTKTLFPVLMDLWKTVQQEEESSMKAFFDLLRLTLRNAAREELPGMLKPIFAFFLDVFDLRHRLQIKGIDAATVNDIEESAIGSFLELVTKLNESTFKPLFIRLYDWAVIDLAEGKGRKIVLLHVMMGLLVKFRNLLSPYIATLLPHIQELLPAYAAGDIEDQALHTLLLDVLSKSFEVDEGAYWNDTLLLSILPNLISQIPLFTSSLSKDDPSAISRTLASFASSTSTENVLRRLNTSICLVTRSDDPKVRIQALKCLDAVWASQAEEMVGLVPETVSEFLAELLEDESHDVEIAARGVLSRIEKITGSLQEYLE